QFEADGFAVNVGHHAAAIEAGFRILAAEFVADIDQTHGVERDFIAFFTDRLRLVVYGFGASARAGSSAGRQEGGRGQRQEKSAPAAHDMRWLLHRQWPSDVRTSDKSVSI